MNRTTSKITSVALIVLTLGVGEALAQATTAQQEACRPDVFRLCGSDIPDVGRIVACLRGNESRLSAACHQVSRPCPKDTPADPISARMWNDVTV
jgi:hypothetical protein